MLLDPSQPGTPEALSLLGVTAIAMHPDAHVDSEVDPRTPGAGFELVGRFADRATVWRVVARPAPAFVMLPGGFAPPHRQEDGSVGYALTSTAGVGVLQVAAKTAGLVRLVFTATPAGGSQPKLRVADSKSEQGFDLSGPTQVAVLVEVPRGLSQLLVKVDPAPSSETDAVVLSLPHAERASGTPALHADLTSPSPGF
jgi:hypothetical protein